LVVVSQNQDLYINLDTTIDCRLLCSKIGKFVDNYNKKFDKVKGQTLVISIKNPTHTISIENPKIEQK